MEEGALFELFTPLLYGELGNEFGLVLTWAAAEAFLAAATAALLLLSVSTASA